MQYSRLHSKRCRYFQITTNTSSIGCYFLACFLTPHLGFLTCFSLPAPTPWVFPLASFLPRPFFSLQPNNKLPEWVFPLTFRSINTRHVFFLLLFRSYTHFSPLLTPTSFRFGFFRLLFFLINTRNKKPPYISRYTVVLNSYLLFTFANNQITLQQAQP